MALFTTLHTTAETAGWSIDRLTAEEVAANVAFYEGEQVAGRRFGETSEDVASRQADARWWLDRFAEAAEK